MKMQLYISNIDSFLKGELDGSFYLATDRFMDNSDAWVHLQEIDIDTSKADIPAMTAKALNTIDKEMENAREELADKLSLLETKRQEFLSLTHIEGE